MRHLFRTILLIPLIAAAAFAGGFLWFLHLVEASGTAPRRSAPHLSASRP